MIDRRTFIVALLATYGCGQKEEPRKSANASQATPPVTELQPVGRKARIGFLFFAAFPPGASPNLDALMLGLRELGYTEGRNLLIERRAADGHADRLPELAAELVRSQVELIIIFGPQPLEAARKATKTIPLVMIASSSDPVAEGVALSLARPGGNITGLTYAASSDRFGKQLELLKSAVDRRGTGGRICHPIRAADDRRLQGIAAGRAPRVRTRLARHTSQEGTSTEFSKAPGPGTCPSNCQPSTNWSSTLRRRRRSA